MLWGEILMIRTISNTCFEGGIYTTQMPHYVAQRKMYDLQNLDDLDSLGCGVKTSNFFYIFWRMYDFFFLDIRVHNFGFVFYFFALWVFIHSRVTGACPVTTDSIMRVNVRP